MPHKTSRWLTASLHLALVWSAVLQPFCVQAQNSSAVEYDENGHLVPATMPHMYRYAFRVQNSLEELMNEREKKGLFASSVRHALRYYLGLNDTDFAVFENAAVSYGVKEKAIRRRITAARKEDWARHPRTWALSPKGRAAVHALVAEAEQGLTDDLATLRAALSSAAAATLDAHIVQFYTSGLTLPKGARLEDRKHSDTTSEGNPSESELSSAPPATCPVCSDPTVTLSPMEWSPDGTTVSGTITITISQTDADNGCMPTGQVSIDQNGAPIVTQQTDSTGGASAVGTATASISVGNSYDPSGGGISCDALGNCSNYVLATQASPFMVAAPSITGISPSSAAIGSSGNGTISGNDLGGPPGNIPTITVTTGTGLDLEATQPTQYSGSGSNLAVGTQAVAYTVDPDASLGQDHYQLSTVWGATTGSLSVTCGAPTIYNVSPTPWTTGTKYNITITGYGFCTGSTLKVTVPTGSVTVTNPVVVNDQTITATVQPSNTTSGEKATVTVTNNGGSSQYSVTIQGVNVGPLYVIDPYLLSGYSSGTLSTGTVLGTLPGNTSNARGLITDGTSTAIVVLQVPSSTTSTTFTVTAGSVAAYSTTFLTKAPTTGQTSITVTPVANGSSYYAMGLVQAPSTPTASSITLTGKTSSGSATASLTLNPPAVILAHGLWGNANSLVSVQNYLLSNHYSSDLVIPICYTSNQHWNDPAGGTGCGQTSVSAIGNALTNPSSGAYAQYDAMHIVGGRVDYVGHSMGGLAARNYSAQSTYLTNVRDRHQGAIHTFITIDTPSQGSALATNLVEDAQCTVQSHVWNVLERLILKKAGCSTTDTVQQCFFNAGMPLAANGAAPSTGAVYSLEPSYVNGVSYPGKPTNSTWISITAQFPDGASQTSMLRVVLQDLIDNFYGNGPGQPAGAPCNTPNTPPTLSAMLGTITNDVIVTIASQDSGISQTPNVTIPESGNLEHTGTPGAGQYAQYIPGYSDANVTNSTAVNQNVLQELQLY